MTMIHTGHSPIAFGKTTYTQMEQTIGTQRAATYKTLLGGEEALCVLGLTMAERLPAWVNTLGKMLPFVDQHFYKPGEKVPFTCGFREDHRETAAIEKQIAVWEPIPQLQTAVRFGTTIVVKGMPAYGDRDFGVEDRGEILPALLKKGIKATGNEFSQNGGEKLEVIHTQTALGNAFDYEQELAAVRGYLCAVASSHTTDAEESPEAKKVWAALERFHQEYTTPFACGDKLTSEKINVEV